MSANQFLAFYHIHPIDKWNLNLVDEYYYEKTGLKKKKKLLNSIKKDQKVRNKSEFNMNHRNKAEEILSNWKVLFIRIIRIDTWMNEQVKKLSLLYSIIYSLCKVPGVL